MTQRLATLFVCLALSTSARAQEEAAATAAMDAEAIHEQLRALRDNMFQAYSDRDMNRLLEDVVQDAVITWQNGDRVLNKQEFMEFYDKMMSGDNRIVEDVTSEFTVDGLSLLYGDDTAVAYGSCVDEFKLSSGKDLQLSSKWTATVVKQDSDWRVASFHISTSVFDNPVLDAAAGWLIYAGLGGAAFGLIVGWVLSRLMGRTSGGSMS